MDRMIEFPNLGIRLSSVGDHITILDLILLFTG